MTRLSYYNLAPDGNENPRLDIPWHAATLIEHDKDRRRVRGGVLAENAEGERGRGTRRKMISNRASNCLTWIPEKWVIRIEQCSPW